VPDSETIATFVEGTSLVTLIETGISARLHSRVEAVELISESSGQEKELNRLRTSRLFNAITPN